MRHAQLPAEEARQYLMSLHGLGRKSVACIVLLGLQLKVRHAVMPITCHLQHSIPGKSACTSSSAPCLGRSELRFLPANLSTVISCTRNTKAITAGVLLNIPSAVCTCCSQHLSCSGTRNRMRAAVQKKRTRNRVPSPQDFPVDTNVGRIFSRLGCSPPPPPPPPSCCRHGSALIWALRGRSGHPAWTAWLARAWCRGLCEWRFPSASFQSGLCGRSRWIPLDSEEAIEDMDVYASEPEVHQYLHQRRALPHLLLVQQFTRGPFVMKRLGSVGLYGYSQLFVFPCAL